MDAVSYSLASKQAQRIEKFIENPDSTSGIVTVPKTIASGETVTVPAGRVAVLPNLQIDGTLDIQGDVFIPSGATFGDLEMQLALKAPILSPALTGTPTAPTQTAGDNSTKLATTAYVDGKMVRGTAVNSTSVTAIDFTGIPSWAKRITVMFNGVSTSSTSVPIVQLGISTGVETSGYVGCGWNGSGSSLSMSNGFLVTNAWDGTVLLGGQMIITNHSGNIWTESYTGGTNTGFMLFSGGRKTLSGTLDRVRITTVNGTDTFDAGSINIMYEG